jgi:PAS domain S-box-containing protein
MIESSEEAAARVRRRLAEEQLQRRRFNEAQDVDRQDPRRLLYELEVHQIELEMQNEELCSAQYEIERGLKRYTELFDFAPIGYLVLGDDGSIQTLNFAAAKLLGMERQRLIGRRLGLFVAEENRRCFHHYLERVFSEYSQKKEIERFELELSLAGDLSETAVRDVHLISTHFEGETPSVLLTAQDITEKKRAKESLQRERDLLQTVMNGAKNSHLVYLDRDFNLVRVNETYAAQCGYRPEEMSGKNYFALFPHAENEALFLRVRDTGEPCEVHDQPLTCPGPPERGTTYWDWTLYPVKEVTGQVTGLVFSLYETTERKQAVAEREKLQAQLLQAQKMEAIGTLAGGVAHDFNNILGGIMGGLSLIALDQAEGEGEGNCLFPSELIQDMLSLVERGANLAKQLLGLGRRGKYEVQPLDLRGVVEKTSTIFSQTHRDITIQLEFPNDLPAVLMDHTQLEQVLLNLYINGAQAMPGGGRLLLQGEQAILTEEQTAPFALAPGRFLKLVISDTGIGMDAATRARIFEPFFTTKDPGCGHGIGLASVYGIVRNHGGLITVESDPGCGASFTLWLPSSDLQPAGNRPLPEALTHDRAGTILVVEDEQPLLKLYTQMLQRMGYDVISASSGKLALKLVRQHNAQLALVILDLTMPEMSGAQTFEELKAIAPEIKVLLASGFSVNGQAQELLDRGCNGFIQKPFTAATLSAKIQSLL